MNTTANDISVTSFPIEDVFERLYTALRVTENRIYSDEEISQLPLINRSHPHYKEWMARKESSERLALRKTFRVGTFESNRHRH